MNLRPFGPEIRTDVLLCHIMTAVVIRRNSSLLPSSDMDENILLQIRCNCCLARLSEYARVIFHLAKFVSSTGDRVFIPQALGYLSNKSLPGLRCHSEVILLLLDRRTKENTGRVRNCIVIFTFCFRWDIINM